MIDSYTKVILTVIAVLLSLLVLQGIGIGRATVLIDTKYNSQLSKYGIPVRICNDLGVSCAVVTSQHGVQVHTTSIQ